jgi:hypothetical protein
VETLRKLDINGLELDPDAMDRAVEEDRKRLKCRKVDGAIVCG